MLWGLLLQFLLPLSILGIPALGIPGMFRFFFDAVSAIFSHLIAFTDQGGSFLFGGLARDTANFGYIFAFRALPSIIFFSALVSVLYWMGIIQKLVRGIAWVMLKTLGSSGAESLSAAANIFVGQVEAPLFIKVYLASMTRSEIFCVMVGGMSTIAAGVMGAYVGLLQNTLPDIGGHLLTACAMAAPGTVLISKMLIPEKGLPETLGTVKMADESKATGNVIEAAARGAGEGLYLAVTVAAVLIAFVGLVALGDSIVGAIGGYFSIKLSLTDLMGRFFGPIAWMIGIPWSEASQVGQLLGQKIILNEFVAYVNLAKIAPQLSHRTLIMTSYALCGFANLSSIGIQIGGIGNLAPVQRSNLARLGLKAVLAGTLVSLMTASIAGLLY